MSCCGQKRAALKQREPSSFAPSRAAPAPPPLAPPPSALSPEYRLRYMGDKPLSLTGMSGRAYYFPYGDFICPVAAADFDALLRTQLFEPAMA